MNDRSLSSQSALLLPAAATSRDANVEDVVLRESLHSRCRQARPAFFATVLNTAVVVPFIGRGLQLRWIAAWLAVLLVLLLIRYRTALQAERNLSAPRPVLELLDQRFRLISLLSQAVVGSGIWMVPQSTTAAAPYWMTMLITVYGVGAVVNLAHDFRTLKITLPILMLQPTLFWLMSGIQGIAMAVILAGITWMMLASARNSMNAFVDSIRIRFEKDALLEQLTLEKQATSRALEAAEQANQKSKLALEAAEKANRQKSFFLAAASHDLRQPLYAASLLGDTLSLHPLGEAAAELVEKQREALKVATTMFNNILDLSRFESGTVPRTLRPLSLERFLAEMESEHRASAEAKGLTFEAGTSDATIVSDYEHLPRLVRNLLSNAIRYTESGGIRLFAVEHDDAVSIVVEDTGIGIAEADWERVFKEFEQLDNPQRSRERGVGLGLAIVRQIEKLLEHPVTLESEVGKGTRIEVRVPLAEAEVSDVAAVATARDDEASAGPTTSFEGMRVWIVEDDPLVRDAMQKYLGLQGCAHRLALDRTELGQLIDTEGMPDFVILDDMLGTGETGLELARWLAERMPQSRVLVTTGNVAPERWAELNASGFTVLRKPLPAASINEWMRRGLGEPARTEAG